MTNMSKVNTLAGPMAIGVEDAQIGRVNAEVLLRKLPDQSVSVWRSGAPMRWRGSSVTLRRL